jgi:DNA-directed RNA polymerase subunit L/DNA-directed RNA polymerase alpha subunit
MSFANLQEEGRISTFQLAPTHVTYANTLRRRILTGVETVAFRADMTATGTTTDVEIVRNDTPMTNEMLADRIGLLPIHVLEPLKWKKDQYIFELEVKGQEGKTTNVEAGQFRIKSMANIMGQDDEKSDASAAEFFPRNPITDSTCLIATLQPGTGPTQQVIHLKAAASIGTGREHARFSPVSQCSYEYTLSDDEDRRQTMFLQWLDTAKKASGVDLESERGKELIREFETMQIKRCFKINDKGEPDSFDFTIESAGVLPVSYIVDRACAVGEQMCSQYMHLHMGDLPDDVIVSTSDSRMIGYDFLFQKHDHTLGNLLQTWLVEHHIEGDEEPKVTYAGYAVPHPLRDEMVLRIGVADRSELTARLAIATAAKGCVTMFKNLRAKWREANGL